MSAEEAQTQQPIVEDQQPQQGEGKVDTVQSLLETLVQVNSQNILREKKTALLLKQMMKLHQKELKSVGKKRTRRTSDEPEPQYEVEERLAKFMKLENGQKVALSEARKSVTAYVKENNLHKKKSEFDVDETLRSLLGEPLYNVEGKNKGYGYLNLNRYLQPLFKIPPKTQAPEASA